jgi:tRNA(adenine34) deaminase
MAGIEMADIDMANIDMAGVDYMDIAIAEAKKSLTSGDVPIGAIIVCDGEIIGRGHNAVEASHDPTAHAETLAIRAASEKLGSYLVDCDMFTTLEPCLMCMGAITLAKIRRLYVAAESEKTGAALRRSGGGIINYERLNHRPEIIKDERPEAAEMLKEFFAKLRKQKMV